MGCSSGSGHAAAARIPAGDRSCGAGRRSPGPGGPRRHGRQSGRSWSARTGRGRRDRALDLSGAGRVLAAAASPPAPPCWARSPPAPHVRAGAIGCCRGRGEADRHQPTASAGPPHVRWTVATTTVARVPSVAPMPPVDPMADDDSAPEPRQRPWQTTPRAQPRRRLASGTFEALLQATTVATTLPSPITEFLSKTRPTAPAARSRRPRMRSGVRSMLHSAGFLDRDLAVG